jgi:hypothetical protein
MNNSGACYRQCLRVTPSCPYRRRARSSAIRRNSRCPIGVTSFEAANADRRSAGPRWQSAILDCGARTWSQRRKKRKKQSKNTHFFAISRHFRPKIGNFHPSQPNGCRRAGRSQPSKCESSRAGSLRARRGDFNRQHNRLRNAPQPRPTPRRRRCSRIRFT